MEDLVLVDRPRNAVACLTLNRPGKKNALSIALRDEVTAALGRLADDDGVSVVVLTGAGGAFSAGFDLDEFGRAMQEPGLYDRIWASGDPYHERLLRFPLPLVAAVDGIALGGGMDTAVLCDVRIASTRASFGHPEASFGDVVYAPLHDLIGGAAARDLCLTGRRIDAAEALRLGLVSEVVEPGALLERALDVAGTIARAPRDLVMRTKAKIVARAAIAFTTTLAL
jgi:enoyl-CoA hydratase/carnithine racemase